MSPATSLLLGFLELSYPAFDQLVAMLAILFESVDLSTPVASLKGFSNYSLASS